MNRLVLLATLLAFVGCGTTEETVDSDGNPLAESFSVDPSSSGVTVDGTSETPDGGADAAPTPRCTDLTTAEQGAFRNLAEVNRARSLTLAQTLQSAAAACDTKPTPAACMDCVVAIIEDVYEDE